MLSNSDIEFLRSDSRLRVFLSESSHCGIPFRRGKCLAVPSLILWQGDFESHKVLLPRALHDIAVDSDSRGAAVFNPKLTSDMRVSLLAHLVFPICGFEKAVIIADMESEFVHRALVLVI